MDRPTAQVFLTTLLLVIGLVASALGTAGVINVDAAHALLIVAWLAAIAGVCTADAFASKPVKHIIKLGFLTALISGIPLYFIDGWVLRKNARESVGSMLQGGNLTPAVDLASEVARSRKSPGHVFPDGPIRTRTQGGGARCSDPVTHPVLNYYPVTFAEEAEFCHDYPIIDVRHSDGKYSQSIEDWLDGLDAREGDELYVAVYINNGAANWNTDPFFVLAKNVSITLQTDTFVGTTHHINIRASADNAETVYGRFSIHTNINERLELIPKAARVYDSTGKTVLSDGFDAGNNTIKLGDLRPNFEDSVFVVYKIKVIV